MSILSLFICSTQFLSNLCLPIVKTKIKRFNIPLQEQCYESCVINSPAGRTFMKSMTFSFHEQAGIWYMYCKQTAICESASVFSCFGLGWSCFPDNRLSGPSSGCSWDKAISAHFLEVWVCVCVGIAVDRCWTNHPTGASVGSNHPVQTACPTWHTNTLMPDWLPNYLMFCPPLIDITCNILYGILFV